MQSKSEIKAGFSSKWEEITNIVSRTYVTGFTYTSTPEIWSIAEEFDHVIKSVAAVSSAMKVSLFILKWRFGKSNRRLRTYDEVLHKYTTALASVDGRAVAPSPFTSEEGKAFDKENMLKHWESTLAKFDQRIHK
jgi:hypothetical protein